jgi:hypothetical protein
MRTDDDQVEDVIFYFTRSRVYEIMAHTPGGDEAASAIVCAGRQNDAVVYENSWIYGSSRKIRFRFRSVISLRMPSVLSLLTNSFAAGKDVPVSCWTDATWTIGRR